MPQQINLCSTSFRPVRQRFGARTLLQSLAVVLVVGGGLVAGWVWSLEQSNATFLQTTVTQATEIASLQVAIQQSRANAAPVDAVLVAQLKDRRLTVKQREELIEVVQQGMFKPGEGHSDRMRMLASSIPSSVWITDARVDNGRLDVTGFTLEPAALNDWAKSLAAHPLMRNLKLTAVHVQNKAETAAVKGDAAAGKPVATRPVWSFSLVNTEPPPLLASTPVSGGKP